jgi:hypothetical protein
MLSGRARVSSHERVKERRRTEGGRETFNKFAGELADAVHLELWKLERKSSERMGLTRNAGGTVEVNLKRDSPDSLPSAGKASW